VDHYERFPTPAHDEASSWRQILVFPGARDDIPPHAAFMVDHHRGRIINISSVELLIAPDRHWLRLYDTAATQDKEEPQAAWPVPDC
jgi:hypothetical protein